MKPPKRVTKESQKLDWNLGAPTLRLGEEGLARRGEVLRTSYYSELHMEHRTLYYFVLSTKYVEVQNTLYD